MLLRELVSPKLGTRLGEVFGTATGTPLLAKWQIDDVRNQQEFYARHVRPRLEEAENRKAYVIISDAFRFEAAQELARELNGKYRFEATLTSQLGVVPSYTALGMASLLPHEKLCYKSNGQVLVDNAPTDSIEQRDAILATVDGMACKAEVLLPMKKEEGREFVSGQAGSVRVSQPRGRHR